MYPLNPVPHSCEISAAVKLFDRLNYISPVSPVHAARFVKAPVAAAVLGFNAKPNKVWFQIIFIMTFFSRSFLCKCEMPF